MHEVSVSSWTLRTRVHIAPHKSSAIVFVGYAVDPLEYRCLDVAPIAAESERIQSSNE